MIKVKIALSVVVTLLITTVTPQSAYANDLAIWDQLKGANPKGYVLVMRHALAPGVGDPENFKIGDCSTQRNLNEEGRLDAQDVGRWLLRQDVNILRVESSRWCRAKETAQLLNVGKVRLNKNLDSLFEDESDWATHPQTANIKKRIIDHRHKRGLLVFVGHFVNFQAAAGVSLDSGEGALVRANAKGEIKVLGYSPKPQN
jgi:phosphohistidine phosphatase SixA